MQLKYRTISAFILSALGALPFVVASPAQAFWFLHHKSDSQTEIAPNNLPSTALPEQPVLIKPVTKGARRLLPIGFINNSHLKGCESGNNTYIEHTGHTSLIPNNNIQKDATSNLGLSNTATSTLTTTGIPLKTSSTYTTTTIKIGIGLNLKNAKIVILDGARLIDNTNGQVLANLPAQSEWLLSSKADHLVLQPAKDYYLAMQQLAKTYDSDSQNVIEPANFNSTTTANSIRNNYIASSISRIAKNLSLMGDSATYSLQPILTKNGKPGLLALNDRIYRGSFLIKIVPPKSTKDSFTEASSPAFNIVNCLDLEDYLISVVPSEMPSLWPAEALKAQTIAARSYAIANLGKHGSSGYDLKDNTEDQVYLGVRSETEQTNSAVIATKGLVLKYGGKPICAYFHSSSGGSTEGAENVWQSSLPYLKAVTDFDQECPLYSWTKNYSIAQTESGLPKDIGQVLSINVLAKGPSGRATYMLINGSNNSRIITGEAARKYFSLPSTNFNVTPAETTYTFVGKGFGHGLGLSQWGAKSLAKHGYNAAQILCYYYNGISIDY